MLVSFSKLEILLFILILGNLGVLGRDTSRSHTLAHNQIRRHPAIVSSQGAEEYAVDWQRLCLWQKRR